jgi:hypothetical protein
MGLDLVETVYRIEEEFEIIIPREVSEKLTTPRMVIDYLMSLPKVNEKWSKDYVELSVWMIIEDEGGIDRKDFNDDSRFVEDMGMG